MGSTTIWFLISSLNIGGTQRTLVDLANGLSSEYDITIWTISEPGTLAPELKDTIKLHSLDTYHKLDIFSIIPFLKAMRNNEPDILQSFLYFDNQLAKISGHISDDTIIINGVRCVRDDLPYRRRIPEKAMFSWADHYISNSKAGKNYIEERGVDREKISVIYNGRDLSAYANASPAEDLIERHPRIDKNIVIGSIGRLVERKGHIDLVRALPKLQQQHGDMSLLIVGSGPQSEQLRRSAEKLDVSESMILTGEREDIPEILSLIDIFAFPSYGEGMPGALLEAMAANLPIITTPVDGNKELIQHEKNGLHFSTGSIDSLIEQINILIENDDFAQCLARSAQKEAFNQYTIERMCDEYSSLYKCLVA